MKHGPRIGRLCDCLRGTACNTFFLRCYWTHTSTIPAFLNLCSCVSVSVCQIHLFLLIKICHEATHGLSCKGAVCPESEIDCESCSHPKSWQKLWNPLRPCLLLLIIIIGLILIFLVGEVSQSTSNVTIILLNLRHWWFLWAPSTHRQEANEWILLLLELWSSQCWNQLLPGPKPDSNGSGL